MCDRETTTTMSMGRPYASANIALTYANDRQMDGAGAQLQRIYGIYAISRFLNLPYVHSPLMRIGYQGLAALESNSSSTELESRYNCVFAIPSDIELPERKVTHDTIHADLKFIEGVHDAAKMAGEFALIRILYPYAISDRHTDIYRHATAASPFQSTKSEVFRLALHVRRGEEMLVDSERMLPNSYYVSAALKFIDALKALEIPFVCELHTEVPSKTFVVTPQHHGIDGRIPGDVTLEPKANRLGDFDAIPNLARFINADPIETLRQMATADALVLSRSSYSYVASILNANCIVVYHPFWHNPLKEWLISDENGGVLDDELVTRLKYWKHNQKLSLAG
jgi:hypothetical protein